LLDKTTTCHHLTQTLASIFYPSSRLSHVAGARRETGDAAVSRKHGSREASTTSIERMLLTTFFLILGFEFGDKYWKLYLGFQIWGFWFSQL